MTTAALQEAARGAHSHIPDTHGFILIVAPFGPGGDQCEGQYVSNCNREDAVRILKTLLFRWGHNEEWVKTIK